MKAKGRSPQAERPSRSAKADALGSEPAVKKARASLLPTTGANHGRFRKRPSVMIPQALASSRINRSVIGLCT